MSGSTWEDVFGSGEAASAAETAGLAGSEDAAGEAAGLAAAQVVPGLDVIVDAVVAAVVIGDVLRKARTKSKAQTSAKATTTPCSDCEPPEDDPCKDVCAQEHGGSHDNMKGPKGDNLHSHHIIGQKAAEDAGLPKSAMGDLPAIRMPLEDHKETGSYGNTRATRQFNQQQTDLLNKGDTQGAFDHGADDIRRKFPNNDNYKTGLEQAQECLDCKRKHGQIK
jgi:hypothetical protein